MAVAGRIILHTIFHDAGGGDGTVAAAPSYALVFFPAARRYGFAMLRQRESAAPATCQMPALLFAVVSVHLHPFRAALPLDGGALPALGMAGLAAWRDSGVLRRRVCFHRLYCFGSDGSVFRGGS